MSFDGLKENVKGIKEIVRELYVYGDQLDKIKNLETGSKVVINAKQKQLLNQTLEPLTNQLRILNNAQIGRASCRERV